MSWKAGSTFPLSGKKKTPEKPKEVARILISKKSTSEEDTSCKNKEKKMVT